MEPDRRHSAAQAGTGAAHRVIPLEVLRPHIQQPDRRLRQPQDRAREDVAHHGELHEVFGVALDVGAEVEHHAFAAPGRENRGDRRPVDAGQGFEHEFGDRHQRAGIARRDDAVGAAIPDRIDRQPHARPSPGAQRLRRLGVVRHRLIGMMQARRLGQPRQPGEQRRDLGLVAEQQELRAGVPLQREIGTLQHHRRGAVAAHRVDGDGDAVAHRANALPLRRRVRRSATAAA